MNSSMDQTVAVSGAGSLQLDVKAVSKGFQQGATHIQVLKAISFQVYAGETLAILGQSGSGKSTLLGLLAGLDRPDQGEISVDGQAINRMSQQQLTRYRGERIGIVFQQFHLMRGLTALENVLLPLDIGGISGGESRAREALELVGLSHRLDHLPHQLSGGECQRVAIARAFVVRPKILLADEPSGNLDSQTGRQVMDMLFNAVKQGGMTMILVSHDRSLARRCARQIQLVSGHMMPFNSSQADLEQDALS